MIDVHELLQKKEDDINRVRKEIRALQLVAPLLSDSDEVPAAPGHGYPEVADISAESNVIQNRIDDQASTQDESSDASSDPIPPKRGILRDWFGRAAGE